AHVWRVCDDDAVVPSEVLGLPQHVVGTVEHLPVEEITFELQVFDAISKTRNQVIARPNKGTSDVSLLELVPEDRLVTGVAVARSQMRQFIGVEAGGADDADPGFDALVEEASLPCSGLHR